ncbi:hypothetical protein ACFVAJ_17365 [Agromyces sp. NPDC057679]|uniref:hypothetical protein n=1 Tax=Agromyces sp. NPDC057679 TaxID=3346207 RepID=UPI00366E7AFE
MLAADVRNLPGARTENPDLTVFDTGEMHEPCLHGARQGVDFDDENGHTVATVRAYRSTVHDHADMITIDAPLVDNMRVVVNDADVVWVYTDGKLEFPPTPGGITVQLTDEQVGAISRFFDRGVEDWNEYAPSSYSDYTSDEEENGNEEVKIGQAALEMMAELIRKRDS